MSFNQRDSNITVDGKVLYIKVHGVCDDFLSGETKTLFFDVPYTRAMFNGAEIIDNVLAETDLHVDAYDPNTQQFVPYEQYGFSVNVGEDRYTREAPYAAEVQVGVRLRCEVTNHDSVTKKMGVNFLLHEVREP